MTNEEAITIISQLIDGCIQKGLFANKESVLKTCEALQTLKNFNNVKEKETIQNGATS